ncbi:hypothetical protein AVEN_611-1 [Araneus ventricosus]|uniref:Integrase catalytic domain-containing protein n=1 Tax=Araneus ventricosus TaxID=182803 RepID=A0A4Y2NMH4_ARAVE|nr:hypothetical protein AVEN_611-1 [Araneus ventricosus]
MYSDNAKTFEKSNRELEEISKILLHDNFHDFICNQKITWKFIVERGAWWGGFYERLVKSVKECLRKVLGRALLSFEEFHNPTHIQSTTDNYNSDGSGGCIEFSSLGLCLQ